MEIAPPSRPLAITCGDPAGVGPEVIAQWLLAHPEQHHDVCLIGPAAWLRAVGAEVVNLETANQVLRTPDAAPRQPARRLRSLGLAVGEATFPLTPGQPNIEGAEIARLALEEAAMGCRDGLFRAVVTGPVSKSWMHQVGWDFPGQTEFFAARWHGEPTMAFAGGRLRVVLVTWHIPLELVPGAVNRTTLTRAVRQAAFFAQRLGCPTPRIAVCGLNPHAGEDGLIGFEEKGHLDPILDDLRPDFPGLSRCLPGDTVFWRQLQGEFDVIVALYHDQGLAPLKTIDFDTSVNCTLGLPFIRTSPDHGTAYSLAGRGQASSTSFGNAVTLCRQLTLGG